MLNFFDADVPKEVYMDKKGSEAEQNAQQDFKASVYEPDMDYEDEGLDTTKIEEIKQYRHKEFADRHNITMQQVIYECVTQ